MAKRQPRGIRNNNPGNLKDFGFAWKGKTGNDGVMAVFDTAENGIIQLMKQLIRNQERRGLDTVAAQIASWAPPVENDTRAYQAAVARALGLAADAPIDVRKLKTLTVLARAIIRHENGVDPYPDALIAAAASAALKL